MNSRSKALSTFAALAAALLSGCQSTPTRIYTLYPVPTDAPRDAYTGPSIRVDAVHFPAALDRIEIVRDLAPGELQVSDADHWSAPLGQIARQALSADLLARLPPGKTVFPHLNKPDGALGLAVDVLDFKVDGRVASLEASWAIGSPGQASGSSIGNATLRTGTAAATAAATAQALSALLGQLADRIVATL